MAKKFPTTAAVQPPTNPRWVIEMHEHVRRNGYYRTADLERVLGDPREAVVVRIDAGLGLLAPHKK